MNSGQKTLIICSLWAAAIAGSWAVYRTVQPGSALEPSVEELEEETTPLANAMLVKTESLEEGAGPTVAVRALPDSVRGEANPAKPQGANADPLHVLVLDRHRGLPIAGAQIQWTQGGATEQNIADATGVIRNVPTSVGSRQWVTVQAPGFVKTRIQAPNSAPKTKYWRIWLAPGFRQKGQVMGLDRKGLAGIRVHSNGGETVETDETGAFELDVFETGLGRGELEFSAIGYSTLSMQIEPELDMLLRPGFWVHGAMQVTLVATTSIKGRVLKGGNRVITAQCDLRFSAQRHHEGLASQLTQYLTEQPSMSSILLPDPHRAILDDDGHFILKGLPPWTRNVRLQMEKPPLLRPQMLGPHLVQELFGPGQELTIPDLQLERPNRKSKAKTEKASLQGVVSLNGRPLEGSVEWRKKHVNPTLTQISEIQIVGGKYHGSVPAGHLEIRINELFEPDPAVEGLAVRPNHKWREVTVETTQTAQEDFLFSIPEGTVTGYLWNGIESNPAPDLAIQIRRRGHKITRTTGSDGSFSFLIPTEKRYELFVSIGGKEFTKKPVYAGEFVSMIIDELQTAIIEIRAEGVAPQRKPTVDVSPLRKELVRATDIQVEVYWRTNAQSPWVLLTSGQGPPGMRLQSTVFLAPCDIAVVADHSGWINQTLLDVQPDAWPLTVQLERGAVIEYHWQTSDRILQMAHIRCVNEKERAALKQGLSEKRKAQGHYRDSGSTRHTDWTRQQEFAGGSLARRELQFGPDGRARIQGLPLGRYELERNFGVRSAWYPIKQTAVDVSLAKTYQFGIR